MKPVETAIARIFSSSGDIVGLGFLISRNRIMTCAHVVADAVGISCDEPTPPQQTISVDFPLVDDNRQCTAEVVIWLPSRNWTDDIAVLELNETAPESTTHAHLIAVENPWGLDFGAYGFPQYNPKGVWASGRVRGAVEGKRIQIEDIEGTSYFIEPGFSGSPVYCDNTEINGVIGMVVSAEADASIKAGFMIPSHVLLAKKDQIVRKKANNSEAEDSESPIETTDTASHPMPRIYRRNMQPRAVYIGRFEEIKPVIQTKRVFVAHRFFGGDANAMDDYRLFLQDGLERIGYAPRFNGNDSGTLLETICQDIINTEAGIYDVSGYNANVLIELGMSIGLNQPTVVIAEDDRQPLIAPLQQLNPLRYESPYDLSEQIGSAVQKQIQKFRQSGMKPRYCAACGLDCIARKYRQSPEDEYVLVGTDPKNVNKIHYHLKKAVKNFNLTWQQLDGDFNLIVCRWVEEVKRSRIVFFHSNSGDTGHSGIDNATTMVRTGIAIGLGVAWRMILQDNDDMPTDLKGYKYVSWDRSPRIFEASLNATVRTLLGEARPYSGMYDPLVPVELVEDEKSILEPTGAEDVSSIIEGENLLGLFNGLVDALTTRFGSNTRLSLWILEDDHLRVATSNAIPIGTTLQPPEGGVLATILTSKEPLYIADATNYPVVTARVGTFLGIPILSEHNVVGVLVMEHPDASAFPQDIKAELTRLSPNLRDLMNGTVSDWRGGEARVFVAYSRRNSDFARRLIDQIDLNVTSNWVDWNSIPITAPNWWQDIKQAIKATNTFVFIVSPASMASVVCNMELDYASELGKRIVPVIYQDVEIRDALASIASFQLDQATQELLAGKDPISMARNNWQRMNTLNWVFFREEDDFRNALDELVLAATNVVASGSQLETQKMRLLKVSSQLQEIATKVLVSRSDVAEEPNSNLLSLWNQIKTHNVAIPSEYTVSIEQFWDVRNHIVHSGAQDEVSVEEIDAVIKDVRPILEWLENLPIQSDSPPAEQGLQSTEYERVSKELYYLWEEGKAELTTDRSVTDIVDTYFRKAYDLAEFYLATYPNSEKFAELFEKAKKEYEALRQDASPLTTYMAISNYKDILSELEVIQREDPTHWVQVEDIAGNLRNVRVNEAISILQTKSADTARRRVVEPEIGYLDMARRHIEEHNPVAADIKLSQARNLQYLPDDVRNEIDYMFANEVQPELRKYRAALKTAEEALAVRDLGVSWKLLVQSENEYPWAPFIDGARIELGKRAQNELDTFKERFKSRVIEDSLENCEVELDRLRKETMYIELLGSEVVNSTILELEDYYKESKQDVKLIRPDQSNLID